MGINGNYAVTMPSVEFLRTGIRKINRSAIANVMARTQNVWSNFREMLPLLTVMGLLDPRNTYIWSVSGM